MLRDGKSSALVSVSYTSCIGISTPRPKASLDPRPSNIRRDGTWHEFTVRSNVPVRVVANDSDRTLRLSSTGRGLSGQQPECLCAAH